MTNDWHGWNYGSGTSLHIGPVPGRKGIAMYTITEGQGTIIAYFKSAEAAHTAVVFIDALCKSLLFQGGEEDS